jgi:hypothetical protein
MGFDKAVELCRNKSANSSLLSVASPEENSFVGSNAVHPIVWLGLNANLEPIATQGHVERGLKLNRNFCLTDTAFCVFQ